MRIRSRVRRARKHLRAAVVSLALVLAAGSLSAHPPKPAAQAQKPTVQSDEQTAALQEFDRRLNAYVKLRSELARKLKPLSTTPSSSELATRQESLAAALQDARAMAKQGDLIPTKVAVQLRKVVQADFQQRKPDARAAAFSEIADAGTTIINRIYPAKAALPTVPPLLLAKLPALPDNLQYRFINRHLVILDGDTELIIDYVSNVLPPR
jgi:hypothetical protein